MVELHPALCRSVRWLTLGCLQNTVKQKTYLILEEVKCSQPAVQDHTGTQSVAV